MGRIDDDAQLFIQLTRKSLLRPLPRLHFAAGKLPQAAMLLVGWTALHKHLPARNERSGNDQQSGNIARGGHPQAVGRIC